MEHDWHFFFKCLFLRERESESESAREREREQEQGRGRERERESQADSAVSTEPDVGLELTNCEIVT